jgi:outer membrane protein insertion porin family
MKQITDDRWRSCLFWLMVAIWAVMVTRSSPSWAQFQGPGMGSRGLGGKKDEAPRYRSPVIEPRQTGESVVAVTITGHRQISENRIRQKLQTRVGRAFDPETVQADVRALSTSGWFQNVRTYKKEVPGGVEVTFEVFELPLIQYIRFLGIGKRSPFGWGRPSEKTLIKKSELKVGEALHRYRVEEARRRIEEFYHEKGFIEAQVDIKEGTRPDDKGVVFAIHEGDVKRVWKTRFVGNTVVSDARLKTQVKSKPGILYYFKGHLDLEQVDADVDRLTTYYRDLGYFNAQISRTMEYDKAEKWLTITFVINEGERYKVRNVSIVGAHAFTTESLTSRLQIKPGDFFDAKKMNNDLVSLRDSYGSQGYIHADIKAEPRFWEEPGQIDLVYDIAEGEQFRVGKIVVNIEGDNPHTRRNVVMNRISLAPGDIIDMREIEASERRLRSSQLFLTDPARGVVPSIAVKPPEFSEDVRYAERAGGSTRARTVSGGSAPRF